VRNVAPAAVFQRSIATAANRLSSHRRALAFAAPCAALIAAAAALTPLADADNTRPRTLGDAKGHTPRPLCPQQPSERQNPTSITRPCFVTGSITGFQLKANGEHHVTRAPSGGKIVAWAIWLGHPNKLERNAFGARSFFGTKRFGKEATARIGVITSKKHGTYKLLRQTPAMKLDQAFGEFHYITLDAPLKIKKGQIVALTTQTWIPALVSEPFAKQSSWRSSAGRKKCIKPGQPPDLRRRRAIDARPQTKIGSTRSYGCIYTDRLLYWAYYVPGR
jgi:hypothetical protein